MKRFTETNKWADPWFRRLSPPAKLLWYYLTDHCDCAGVIELDMEAVAFFTGLAVEEKHLAELVDRVQRIQRGKLFISGFIPFQYGELSEVNLAHRGVIKKLEAAGIDATQFLGDPEAFAERFRIGKATRRSILIRDNMTCQYCGVTGTFKNLYVDHIIPKIRGGSNADDNLACCCLSCNSKKGSMEAAAFLNSLKAPTKLLNGAIKKLNAPQVQEKEKVQVQEKSTEGEVQEGGKNKRKPDSRDEVVAYIRELGLPETDGHYMFDHWEGNGYRNAGKPIQDWKATIRSWQRANHLPSLKAHLQPSAFQRPLSAHEIKTRIQAIIAERNKIYQSFPNGQIPEAERRQMNELQKRRDQLEAQLTE